MEREEALHGASARLRTLSVDLHVHTVVSPCAEVEMIPPFIVRQARALGLGAIAITDHNTVENAGAVMRAAQGTGVAVLPGMETQTREEAHILCLFDTLEQACAWEQVVYAHLPPLANRAEVFGEQFVVDETGEYLRTNERLLLTSTSLTVEEVVAGVRALEGLPIAAHVDRPAFSLLANLGFIPVGLALGALELSAHCEPQAFVAQNPAVRGWPLIGSGDAHRLSELRARTRVCVQAVSTAELELAFWDQQGRSLEPLR